MRRVCEKGSCSFRLQAEVLLLLLLLTACGATTSATHDDASVSTRVKIALLNDPQVAPFRIDAKTFQGVVTLSGTVKSQSDVDQAIAAARRVKGVKDVKSELRIEFPRAPAVEFGRDTDDPRDSSGA